MRGRFEQEGIVNKIKLIIIADLLLLCIYCPVRARELHLLIETKRDSVQIDTPFAGGFQPTIWHGHIGKFRTAPDGAIYLQGTVALNKFSRDGRYFGPVSLDTGDGYIGWGVKDFLGIDLSGKLWFYCPWFVDNEDDYGECDLRQNLICFDYNGKLIHKFKLKLPDNRKLAYHGYTFRADMLPDGRFHLHHRGNRGYLFDSLGVNLGLSPGDDVSDVYGRFYKGGYDVVDEYGYANRSWVALIDTTKRNNDVDPVLLPVESINSVFDSLAKTGVTYFPAWQGSNRKGHMLIWLAEESGRLDEGELNQTFFQYLLFDSGIQRVIESGKVYWNAPHGGAPTIQQVLLDEDDSILISGEFPKEHWVVDSRPGEGMTGIRISPGPGGSTFRLYRLE